MEISILKFVYRTYIYNIFMIVFAIFLLSFVFAKKNIWNKNIGNKHNEHPWNELENLL